MVWGVGWMGVGVDVVYRACAGLQCVELIPRVRGGWGCRV